MLHIALFQPDIPQNTGTITRMCAALKIHLHIIEPCGFIWDDRRQRRAAMDYAAHADLTRHADWQEFLQSGRNKAGINRLLLLTTKGAQAYHRFTFQDHDCLLLGRESAGAPDYVHNAADHRLVIPQHQGRSLNIAMAGAMVLGEALRQCDGFATL